MGTTNYNKKKYEKDFKKKVLNVKTVKLKLDDPFYENMHVAGVLMHDGKLMVNGVLLEDDEFEIINENPLGTE